jgi:hypothetical protein
MSVSLGLWPWGKIIIGWGYRRECFDLRNRKTEKITYEKLHNAPRVIISWGMIQIGHAVCIEKVTDMSAYKMQLENVEGRDIQDTRHKWEDIKMNLKEIGCEGVVWILVARIRARRWLVDTVMTKNRGISWWVNSCHLEKRPADEVRCQSLVLYPELLQGFGLQIQQGWPTDQVSGAVH